MKRIGWENRLGGLRQELASTKSRAHMDTTMFRELHRQVECYKIQSLTYQLDVRRKTLARSREISSITKNERSLPASLGIAAASFILIGLMSKDESAALNAGFSGFNGALRGLGKSEWAVCLGRQLTIVSQDNITPGQAWFTWDSVMGALFELEQQAKKGARLGNLEAIISELRRSKRLAVISTRANL